MKLISNWFISTIAILALGIIALYIYLTPCNVPVLTGEYWVTIHGKVLPSPNITEKDTAQRPRFMYVYYPYFNPEYVCNSKEIQLADITWLNDNEGIYSITFTLSVDMEVILTTDCTGCNPKRVSISRSNNNVEADVFWGTEKCYSEYDIPDSVDEIISRNQNRFDYMDIELTTKNFNASEKQDIKSDIKDGREQIRNSNEIKTDINESIKHALYSEFFFWRAKYKWELFDLKYCIEDIDKLEGQFIDKCYYHDYSSVLDYNDAKSVYQSSLNSNILRYGAYDLQKIEIKSYIGNINNNWDRLRNINGKCEGSSYKLNKTLEYQKSYCEHRKNMCNLVNLTYIIIILSIGVLIGNWSAKNQKNNNEKGEK